MRLSLHFAHSTTLVLACATVVFAHAERPIQSPMRPGPVPAIERVNPNRLVVCKPESKPTQAQLADIQARLETATGEELAQAQRELRAWQRNDGLFAECCFSHIQDAVNAAGDDTDILMMPGVYLEEPSRAAPTSARGDNNDGTYSYEYHVQHPNDASLIAVLGKNNITIEGTGASPSDVVIDAGFVKDVGIRCDRCLGFIARNFWEKDANEHGVYTVDSDGYVYDRVIGSYNKEYELFAFASDNGLMVDCEAIGGGDSGFYLGGTPETPGRYSHQLIRAKMHHNALGFSGTQGNSVLIADSDIYDNAIGISFDSENDHPNFPQRKSVIENNDIHDNNFDVYAADSDVPVRGPGYSFFRYPVGTGMWVIGGEDNVVRNNRIYNNGRFGVLISANAAEAPLEARINRNMIGPNLIGTAAGEGAGPNSFNFAPGGFYAPGGSDYYWDGTGNDNCFTVNAGEKIDPDPIPGPCPMPNMGIDGTYPGLEKLALLISCVLVPIPEEPDEYRTADTAYPCPWGQTNDAPYESAAERECGNGALDLGEQCDPEAELTADTCESLGRGSGGLSCDEHCQWNFTACSNPTGPSPTPQNPGCPAIAQPTPTATATNTDLASTPTATPQPTDTATLTPATATATALPTNTSLPAATEPAAPTATPSSVPSATATPGFGLSGGCSTSTSDGGNASVLLLAGAFPLLLLRRRRSVR